MNTKVNGWRILALTWFLISLGAATVVAVAVYCDPPKDSREFTITVTDGETVKTHRAPADSITIADGKMVIISATGNKPATQLAGKCINIR